MFRHQAAALSGFVMLVALLGCSGALQDAQNQVAADSFRAMATRINDVADSPHKKTIAGVLSKCVTAADNGKINVIEIAEFQAVFDKALEDKAINAAEAVSMESIGRKIAQ